MWNLMYSNNICYKNEKMREQNLHIERVLSVKSRTDSRGPKTPVFLKLKLKKKEMEREERKKIDYENKNLMDKLINAEIKHSKYSKTITPSECPCYSEKARLYHKLVEEINNYKDNISLVNKIESVKSAYSIKQLNKTSDNYQVIANRIKRKDRVLHPFINFKSPEFFQRIIKNYSPDKNYSTRNNNYDTNQSKKSLKRSQSAMKIKRSN